MTLPGVDECDSHRAFQRQARSLLNRSSPCARARQPIVERGQLERARRLRYTLAGGRASLNCCATSVATLHSTPAFATGPHAARRRPLRDASHLCWRQSCKPVVRVSARRPAPDEQSRGQEVAIACDRSPTRHRVIEHRPQPGTALTAVAPGGGDDESAAARVQQQRTGPPRRGWDRATRRPELVPKKHDGLRALDSAADRVISMTQDTEHPRSRAQTARAGATFLPRERLADQGERVRRSHVATGSVAPAAISVPAGKRAAR